VYLNLSVVLGLDAGRLHEALQLTQRGLEQMRELGLEFALPSSTLRGELGWQLWDLGRWQEAEELVTEEMLRELPAAMALHLHLVLGRIHMARGQVELATEEAEAARRMVGQLNDPISDSCLQGYLAELAALEGDYPVARSAIAKALRDLADSEQHVDTLRFCRTGLRAAADAAERAHDRRAAAAAIADIQATGEQLLATARQALIQVGTQIPEANAQAAGCEAEFTRLELRSDPQQWAAVVENWDALSRPYEAAYARWRRAEALLAAKAPKAAASALRQAHDATMQLGEEPIRREIERLAQRARIDLTPPTATVNKAATPSAATRHGLTAREQEVLQHLVEGRTNRQIARALFISEKTASVHVSNIMSKLGAANRSEAAAIAHRLRLLEPNA
jgi:DNA-binding CsgD family transcriptional regulator